MEETDGTYAYDGATDDDQSEPRTSLVAEARLWIFYRRRRLAVAAIAASGAICFLACAIAFLDATWELPHLLTLLLPEGFIAAAVGITRVAVKRATDSPALATLCFRLMWGLLVVAAGVDLTTAFLYGYGVLWGAVVTVLPVASALPYLAYGSASPVAIRALRRGA